jgi:DNA-binding SARP family transcriptional activator
MDIGTLPRVTGLAQSPGVGTGPLVRLRLIGLMEASTASGLSVLPSGRKTRALLAMLALADPRPLLRARLAELLWSHRPEVQARASLRQEIHRLTEALAPFCSAVLRTTRDHLALKAGAIATDVGELYRPLPADRALSQLPTGILLEGLEGTDPAFDVWLAAERERLGDHVRGLAEARLNDQTSPEATIAAARQLIAIDRAHEGAWRALMRAHAARGERAMAIEAYERCCAALSASVDAGPSAETDRLLAEIRGTCPSATRPTGKRRGRGPRVGVRPLAPIGGAEPQLAIGIAEEITAALARFPDFCVVSSPALGQGGAPGRDEEAFRHSLQLDLLLEGTLQRADSRVRALFRLLDLRDGDEVVWTRRFDGVSEDPLSLQDEIAAGVAAELDPVIMLLEARRARLNDIVDQSASDLLLRALPTIVRLEHGPFHEAGELLASAVAREPANAAAHSWYALWHWFWVGQGWAPFPAAALARSSALAERAIQLDKGDARSLAIAAHIRASVQRRACEAMTLFERAFLLNPNLAMTSALSGLALARIGDAAEAERHLERYKSLSPFDPWAFFFDTGFVITSLLRRDHARAAALGRHVSEMNPGFSDALKPYLAALGHLGRREEAALVRRRLLAIEPCFTIARFLGASPFDSPADTEHIAEGLGLAGVPADMAESG